MPQMAPMLWLVLFIITNMIYMSKLIVVYFDYSHEQNQPTTERSSIKPTSILLSW